MSNLEKVNKSFFLAIFCILAFSGIHAIGQPVQIRGPQFVHSGEAIVLTVSGPEPLGDYTLYVADMAGYALSPEAGGQLVRQAGHAWRYTAPAIFALRKVAIRARTASDTPLACLDILPPRTAEAEGKEEMKAPAAPPPPAGGLPRPAAPLPADLFNLIAGYAGSALLTFDPVRWPFYNLEENRRFAAGPPYDMDRRGHLKDVRELETFAGPGNCLATGPYGLPAPYRRPAAPAGSLSLLSFRDEYTGMVTYQACRADTPAELTITGHVDSFLYETLETPPGRPMGSQFRTMQVIARGLRPLAGVPGERGSRIGKGLAARLSPSLGLVACSRAGEPVRVFTQMDSNAIYICTDKGAVGILCGQPGRAGYQDGPGSKALFDNPTFLALGHGYTFARHVDQRNLIYVSDTGNHAIRSIHLKTGEVRTLCRGGVLGDPRGLAAGRDGLLVADGATHAIYGVPYAPGAAPVLLFGHPGEAGHQDGDGGAARFSDLRGMVTMEAGGRHPLYTNFFVDGNAIRGFHSFHNRITTIVGSVAETGNVNSPLDRVPDGTPCFNHPGGLASYNKWLFISDTGNNAIKKYDLETGTLETIVANPRNDPTTWGLLWDGMAEVPAEGYARVRVPFALTFLRELGTTHPFSDPLCLVLSSDSCLAEIPAVSRWWGARPRLRFIHPDAETVAGQPCAVGFNLSLGHGAGLAPFEFHYEVDFLHDDGSPFLDDAGEPLPGTRLMGRGMADSLLRLAGITPPVPGDMRIRVRVVTIYGESAVGEEQVRVVAPAAGR